MEDVPKILINSSDLVLRSLGLTYVSFLGKLIFFL